MFIIAFYVHRGKVWLTGSSPAKMAASHVHFEGYLKFVLPLVKERQSVTVDVGLFNDKNKLIHDSAYNIEVFPVAEKGKKLDNPSGYEQSLITKYC